MVVESMALFGSSAPETKDAPIPDSTTSTTSMIPVANSTPNIDPAQDPIAEPMKMEEVVENKTATPEHCFHAFDALYCALTGAQHVKPEFPDDK